MLCSSSPTPKSWIYVTTLYFPKNTFNIPGLIWLRSKQLPQALWLHLSQVYKQPCEWGLVRKKLWYSLSVILVWVSGLPKIIIIKKIVFLSFLFPGDFRNSEEFLKLMKEAIPKVTELFPAPLWCQRAECYPHGFFLLNGFCTYYPFSALTLTRLPLWQCETAAGWSWYVFCGILVL